MSTDRETLRAVLSDVDYPATKDDLVDRAQHNDADADTLRALRSLQPVEYGDFTEVVRSVTLHTGPEEGRTSSEKAKQARDNADSGLAEHQTEVPPNPIAEEIGENRKA
ncbi:DUF2795 domain-containing protein [Saccharopolyspora sp. HNM0983]|uniref:DUF2795 domain-containing protein n=1 Tax=Saccharopolyspora montiporae TaxID=2781240 RepID=A0A929BA09_9PSEU|nr:DUF2795 domain-containing protein [Saccharopolyspora sp. HNM0983]MBE9376049.1 DUF2795 domain-containing protein [Saccharopolyspora sp. HNM0983]